MNPTNPYGGTYASYASLPQSGHCSAAGGGYPEGQQATPMHPVNPMNPSVATAAAAIVAPAAAATLKDSKLPPTGHDPAARAAATARNRLDRAPLPAPMTDDAALAQVL